MCGRSLRLGVLVLGMHRSGTSLLTGLLALHGLRLPSGLLGPQPENPKGFFEPAALPPFNDDLLRAAGLQQVAPWADPRPLDPAWLAAGAASAIVPAQELARRILPEESAFVLKDPRLCRLLPVWRPALEGLGIGLAAVIVVRNPLAVVASLQARSRFDTARAARLWLVHLLEAEAATRDLPRAVVHIEALLADWRALIGSVLPRLGLTGEADPAAVRALLDPSLLHQAAAPDAALVPDALPPPVVRAYAELLRDPAQPGRAEIMDAIAAEIAAGA